MSVDGTFTTYMHEVEAYWNEHKDLPPMRQIMTPEGRQLLPLTVDDYADFQNGAAILRRLFKEGAASVLCDSKLLDLAEAHVKAVERLVHNKQAENFEVFNIGTGNGFSVLEVIHSFEKENNIKVPHKIGPRRAGDVVKVWADTTKVNQVLGWTAKRGLDEMMRDSWNWQLKLKKG
jgi:nucleoside-diphosphate-sugar epimerase